ncbi:NAD(P)-binding protein [Lepidopterella palustris CBS 459.81]|uniref:NAD(P)-binding protein n=1 Tax=Lepidopterella palustris CBS 459.81 TaxID=1314670 RepID=A0A8E2JEV7_9PEZI|nr:NAD(P)-binding protein [Lepidopterella palustris CBS 459.81]
MIPALRAVSASALRPIPSQLQNVRYAHKDSGPAGSTRENVGRQKFRDFDLAGGVFVVTGGARGLGLCMAEALVEAGGKVHCLDRLPSPDDSFGEAQRRVLPEFGGELHYAQVDVRNQEALDSVIARIAEDRQRLDGLIAAAGVQQICPSIEYTVKDATAMLDINYTAVFMTATVVARQMMRFRTRGSICLIASISGLVANKGLFSPVYNSSKAAVIQLARSLAMEWGKVQPDGTGGLRVNSLSPGHIVTPMVLKNFKEVPGLRETWERENMLGRLSKPEEFKSAGLFLLSKASSFMTGTNLVIDGGHTAW